MGVANPTSRVLISDHATVDIGCQNKTSGCRGFLRWPTAHKIEIKLRPICFAGHKTDKVRNTRLLWANSPRVILRMACACLQRGFYAPSVTGLGGPSYCGRTLHSERFELTKGTVLAGKFFISSALWVLINCRWQNMSPN